MSLSPPEGPTSPASPISPATLDPGHLARLARLALPGDELERLARDVARIVGYVDELRQLDLAAVPPTSHPLDLTSPPRPDVAAEPMPRDLALAGAPRHDENTFVVPRVV